MGPSLGGAGHTFQQPLSITKGSAGSYHENLSVFMYQTLLDKVAEVERKIKQEITQEMEGKIKKVQYESFQKDRRARTAADGRDTGKGIVR